MTWRGDVERLRQQAADNVPQWLETGHLPPLGRLASVVGQVGYALGAWLLLERRKGGTTSKQAISRRLRVAFGRLGPTYIKLGQIISGGEGLFPEELVSEFKLLRDRVPRRGLRPRAARRRDGPRSLARRRVRQLRPHAARGGVDRAGARGPAAHRRSRSW